MLCEQISLRRDEFRLKSANHILVKMSKITNSTLVYKLCPWTDLFHSVNAPVPPRHQE